MSVQHWDVEYEGIWMEVTGIYKPGVKAHLTADPYHSTPPEGAEIENMDIKCNGHSIMTAMEQDTIDHIMEMVIEGEEQ
jgi:hypothetical protein